MPDIFDSAALPTAALGVAGISVAVHFATVNFVVSTTNKLGQLLRRWAGGPPPLKFAPKTNLAPIVILNVRGRCWADN